jgi:two-component system phosphate regulon sensor histidine kinase PhoR
MNLFAKASVRLALFYALVLIAVIVTVDTFVNYNRTLVVEKNIASEVTPDIAQQIASTIDRTVGDLRTPNYAFYVLLTLLVGGVSYALARNTLKPIDAMVQSQQRFLANAAHELRTPLTLLRTETELSLRDASHLSHDELLGVMKSVSEESMKMADIINNLLLVSSASMGKHAIPFVEVDFSDAVTRALKNVAGLATQLQVPIRPSIAPHLEVRGNAVALEQIATNLIRNALIHTPAPGTVSVTLAKSKRSASLEVEDTGVGIRKEELPHIFEPFFKGTIKHKEQKRGTGLGLPIVKELVQIHGGTIIVSSEPHKGTTVRVTVPLA